MAHFLDPNRLIRLEMPRHEGLVDGFVNPAKGRCEHHIPQGFTHEELRRRMQTHATDLFLDDFVFRIIEAVTLVGGAVSAHSSATPEWRLDGNYSEADGDLIVVEIVKYHDRVACLGFGQNFAAQHARVGHWPQAYPQSANCAPNR